MSFNLQQFLENPSHEKVQPSLGSSLSAKLKVRLTRLQLEAQEKESVRKAEYDLRLQASSEGSTSLHARSHQQGFDVSKNVSLVPAFREAEVDSYFSAFERIASALNWPRDMWPVLLQLDGLRLQFSQTCLSPVLISFSVTTLLEDRECQQSFEDLKSLLSCNPVVSAPNFSLPFKLEVDASAVGAGAVLLQEDPQEPGYLRKTYSTELVVGVNRYLYLFKLDCLFFFTMELKP
ncbi:hypothetical protein D4764_03G0002960 [Takifugu flavidus]|uniref:Reverse transcriptase/retrotransposon-derived protein RNase H-like domain-containing protein n=1 Tax=Takifugu flavidus TaxID=433684 RepID=A0A5C6N917_9TELE|nr:hypothetical protein D4764_03G0002960 [Takifugu flavidus]